MRSNEEKEQGIMKQIVGSNSGAWIRIHYINYKTLEPSSKSFFRESKSSSNSSDKIKRGRDGEVGFPSVAAIGSLKSIDPERIILKKITFTGYPRRVSKLKATVRYMFHDPIDVSYFKRCEIWTKNGVRGNIKESVGTHGTMKCTFNRSIQQHDTVCMSLFKRVYPKWPEQRFPILLDA